jgi:hypothetical protein
MICCIWSFLHCHFHHLCGNFKSFEVGK